MQAMRDALEKAIANMTAEQQCQARKELERLFNTVANTPAKWGWNKCFRWVDATRIMSWPASNTMNISTQTWGVPVLWSLYGQGHQAIKVQIGDRIFYIENGGHFFTPGDVPFYHFPVDHP